MKIELKYINDNKTQLKASVKQNKFLIEQLKFIGAVPVKESSRYIYFEFEGICLGLQICLVLEFKMEEHNSESKRFYKYS